MDISKPFHDSWDFIKKRPDVFLPGMIYGFVSALLLVFSMSAFRKIYLTAINNPFAFFMAFDLRLLVYIFLLVIVNIVVLFFSSVWIISIATDKKANLSASFWRASGKFPISIFAAIVFYLLAAAGFILFIIPGIYITIRLLFVNQAIVLEKKGPLSSLSRSWQLTENRWWDVFMVLLVLCLLGFVLSIPMVVIDFIPFDGIYIFLLSTFFLAFSNLVLTFFYLDLRKSQ